MKYRCSAKNSRAQTLKSVIGNSAMSDSMPNARNESRNQRSEAPLITSAVELAAPAPGVAADEISANTPSQP